MSLDKSPRGEYGPVAVRFYLPEVSARYPAEIAAVLPTRTGQVTIAIGMIAGQVNLDMSLDTARALAERLGAMVAEDEAEIQAAKAATPQRRRKDGDA